MEIHNYFDIITYSALRTQSRYYSTRLVIRRLDGNKNTPFLVCTERLYFQDHRFAFLHAEFFDIDWFSNHDLALNFYWRRVNSYWKKKDETELGL